MSDSINEKDDDEIVVVEEKPKAQAVTSEEDDDDEKQLEDSRTGSDDDDGENDDDREAIRERRRLEKKERRERRETAMRRDKTELDFLRSRNEDLERRMMRIENESQQTQLSNIDAQIAAARQRANLAEQVFAKAVAAQNGEDAAKAMTYRDEAKTLVAQLESYKAHHQNQAAQQREQQAQPRQQQNELPATVQRFAQKFISDNNWYDPQGRDEDSAIVMAIDSTLTKEGYDPSTEEYWTELRERAARRIPERFQPEKQRSNRQPGGGPSLGSGREGRNTTGRREVYISPERKQAMLDAGVWDDPVLRAKYVKRYEQYDRDNKPRR